MALQLIYYEIVSAAVCFQQVKNKMKTIFLKNIYRLN